MPPSPPLSHSFKLVLHHLSHEPSSCFSCFNSSIMDASVSRPSPRERRLSELLEERLEPFDLDGYLLENGYSLRTSSSQPPFMCWPGGNRHRRRHIGFRRGRFLRCLLTKIVYGNSIRKALNWESKSNVNGRLGVSDCSGCSHQVASNTHVAERHQWSFFVVEHPKQLSPVSVLELHSSESSPFHSHSKEEKHSSSIPDLPQSIEISTTFEGMMLEYSCFSPPISQHGEKGLNLSHLDHLLLDCVEELKERILVSDQCLDPETAESFIQEQMLSWWRRRGDEGGIDQLVESDFSNSVKEWRLFQHQLREIGTEIEAAIFEEIIEEAILDMLRLYSRST